VNGRSVGLDVDMANWPTDHVSYSGTLAGQQFTATYTQEADGVCRFRGGTLTGAFASDGLSLDANETVVWGEGVSETRVQRRWHATKR
jgi:hypothetical protein